MKSTRLLRNLQLLPTASLLRTCIVTTLVFSGCSVFDIFSDSEQEIEHQEQRVRTRGSESPRFRTNVSKLRPRATQDDVELIWEMPSESVDGYLISYRYLPDSRPEEIKVPVTDLGKFEHKEYGFVYRYLLKGVDASKPISVTLTAYKGESASTPSLPFVIEAQQ